MAAAGAAAAAALGGSATLAAEAAMAAAKVSGAAPNRRIHRADRLGSRGLLGLGSRVSVETGFDGGEIAPSFWLAGWLVGWLVGCLVAWLLGGETILFASCMFEGLVFDGPVCVVFFW